MPSPEAATDPAPRGPPGKRSRFARLIHVLSIPIILFWLALAVVTNVFVPSLEETTSDFAAPMIPREAPSSADAVRTGQAYDESDYTSVAVVIMETQGGRKLGATDHAFNDELVRRLREDHKHVQSVQDLWGDPVTKSGQQSPDAEAATITVRPSGDQGDASANESIEAIRDIVDKTPKPEDRKSTRLNSSHHS